MVAQETETYLSSRPRPESSDLTKRSSSDSSIEELTNEVAAVDENSNHTHTTGTGIRNRRISDASSRTLDQTKTQPQVSISISADAHDPLYLSRGKKSSQDLRDLQKASGGKKLQKFYKSQNELIDEILAPIEEQSRESERKRDLKVKIAIYGSFAATMVLICLQVAAAILSGSLSLFATMADACMDLLSSVILLTTSYLAGKKEVYRYPSGKGRFQTIGIVVVGSLMSTLSLQLISQAAQSLMGTPEKPDLGIMSISFVGIALVTKACLFLYCRLLTDPTAQMLSQDHRNDILLNSVGLGLGYLGSRYNPLIDPIGAILVALVILASWTTTVLEHCQLVAGKCADPTFVKRIIHIAMTHDDAVLQVDTCRAYHAGTNLIVEVDIVLAPETTLRVAHDIGESLQTKLESLPNVDRAFVHCDHDSIHHPEHRKNK